MPIVPLNVASLMTQQQGSDLVSAVQTVQAVIGILSSPDPASANAKLNTLIARIGDKNTADTLIKFLSDVSGGLGNTGSTPATSPSSASTVIGYLKYISSLLQTISKQSSTCTKATATVTTTSGPIITSGSKHAWMISNPNSSTVYVEYGAAATVAGGFPIPAQAALIDDFNFNGAVNGIAASGSLTIDFRVFTN